MRLLQRVGTPCGLWLAVALCGIVGCAPPPETIALEIHYQANREHPLNQWITRLAQTLEIAQPHSPHEQAEPGRDTPNQETFTPAASREKRNTRLSLRPVPHPIETDPAVLYDRVERGEADLVLIPGSALADAVPSFQICAMPLLFAEQQAAMQFFLDGPGSTILPAVTGAVALGWWRGETHCLAGTEPFAPSDGPGPACACGPHPLLIDALGAIGLRPEIVPEMEIGSALDSGRVTLVETVLCAVMDSPLSAHVSHVTLTRHLVDPLVLLASRPAHERLQAAGLAVALHEAVQSTGRQQWKAAGAEEEQTVEQLVAAGKQVVSTDIAALVRRVAPLYAQPEIRFSPAGEFAAQVLSASGSDPQ